jgi:hypothetical protein
MWPPPWGLASGGPLMPWGPPTGGGYWPPPCLTLDSTLAAGSGTMDVATALGTSSRRAVDAVANVTDVVRTSSSRRVRSGMISVFL